MDTSQSASAHRASRTSRFDHIPLSHHLRQSWLLPLLALLASCGKPAVVTPTVSEVTIAEGNQTLTQGETFTFTAVVRTVCGANDRVNWASSEPSIVRADGEGRVTALSLGTALITATSLFDDTFADTVQVTVIETAGGPEEPEGPDIEVKRTAHSMLAAGEQHVLALGDNGEVWAWGNNARGQLGNGTTVDSSSPVRIAGLTDIARVAVGNLHSLALSESGTVWAWGDNTSGQAGKDNWSHEQVTTPSVVSGLKALDVAGGYFHSLALCADGTVWAWGSNWSGQLGSGPDWNRFSPEQVPGIDNVVQIAAGTSHSVALKADGTVWGWGSNEYGEAGSPMLSARSPDPAQVAGLSGIVAIAAGWQQNLALKDDGTVWAWGYDIIDHIDHSAEPKQIVGIGSAVDVATGSWHSLASLSDGTVATWGFNLYGQLGTSSLEPGPHIVPGLSGTIAVAGSYMSSYALSNDGTVRSWGANEFGELGDGTQLHSNVPVVLPASTDLLAMDTTFEHTLLLNSNGTVESLGLNSFGALGTQDTDNRSIPTPVVGLNGIVQVSAGWTHSLALADNDVVWAWGDNRYGQLAAEMSWESSTTAIAISGLPEVSEVSAGYWHSLALGRDGTVWAWGWTDFPSVTADPSIAYVPFQVEGIDDAVAITAGGLFSFALRNDGTVWAWGANGLGRLGDGGTELTYPPIQITDLSGVVQIDAGYVHSLAVTADGTAWTWGWNATAPQWAEDGFDPTPTALGLTNVTAVRAGHDHSLALLEDGTVWAWGINRSGALGNGSYETSSQPIQVLGLTNIEQIAAGDGVSMAMDTDGVVWVWGSNYYGQLGDGRDVKREIPGNVVGLPPIGVQAP